MFRVKSAWTRNTGESRCLEAVGCVDYLFSQELKP